MPACPSCHAEVAAGTRWCGLCRINVIDPAVGRLASPGKRFWASVLDVTIPIAALIVISAVGLAGQAAGGPEAGRRLGSFLVLVLVVAFVVWEVVLFSRGTTPGKHLLRMYVVREDGRRAGFLVMLFREWIGKFISGMMFFLGYLWILIDRDRQGWHDKLASTYVVEERT